MSRQEKFFNLVKIEDLDLVKAVVKHSGDDHIVLEVLEKLVADEALKAYICWKYRGVEDVSPDLFVKELDEDNRNCAVKLLWKTDPRINKDSAEQRMVELSRIVAKSSALAQAEFVVWKNTPTPHRLTNTEKFQQMSKAKTNFFDSQNNQCNIGSSNIECKGAEQSSNSKRMSNEPANRTHGSTQTDGNSICLMSNRVPIFLCLLAVIVGLRTAKCSVYAVSTSCLFKGKQKPNERLLLSQGNSDCDEALAKLNTARKVSGGYRGGPSRPSRPVKIVYAPAHVVYAPARAPPVVIQRNQQPQPRAVVVRSSSGLSVLPAVILTAGAVFNRLP